MNKRAFLERMRARLRGLPRREVEERLNFYIEMIDDRIEDGISEIEAVAAVGDVDKLAMQIRTELSSKEKGSVSEPKRWRAWEILLVVLGSPLWITLLAAALCIVLAVFIVIWSVNLTLWVVELPFFIFQYISKYLLICCKAISLKSWELTKYTLSGIKKLFSFK